MRNKKQVKTVEQTARHRSAHVDNKSKSFSYYASRRTPILGDSAWSTPRSRSLRDETNSPGMTTKTRRLKRRRLILWTSILAAIFVATWLTLLRTSVQVVCKIDGAQAASCDKDSYSLAATKALEKSVISRNKITIDTKQVVKDIRAAHPELERVEVAVPLFGTEPTIYVTVSTPAYTLSVGPSRYTLSESGYITAATGLPAPAVEVRDLSGESVSVSAPLLPSSHVVFMQRVQYQLEQAHYSIEYFVLPQGKAYELDVKLKNKPFFVKLNFQEDPMRQSGALLSVLRTLGSTNPGEYIDVRVPGRAYYK